MNPYTPYFLRLSIRTVHNTKCSLKRPGQTEGMNNLATPLRTAQTLWSRTFITKLFSGLGGHSGRDARPHALAAFRQWG